MGKKVLTGALVGAVVLGAGAFAWYQAKVRGWLRYNEYDIRTEGQLQVGDLAPELELARVGGEGKVAL